MNTRLDPRELAELVARRANDFASTPYQIGAVLADRHGVFSWGWCHRGNRSWLRSVHAERHAIERANPLRLRNATLYVAGRRRNSGRVVLARPCRDCWSLAINNWSVYNIHWTDPEQPQGWSWWRMNWENK